MIRCFRYQSFTWHCLSLNAKEGEATKHHPLPQYLSSLLLSTHSGFWASIILLSILWRHRNAELSGPSQASLRTGAEDCGTRLTLPHCNFHKKVCSTTHESLRGYNLSKILLLIPTKSNVRFFLGPDVFVKVGFFTSLF